jgi:general secretion pathway protein D
VAGEYDKAQSVFESILAVDPHNTEAIRWRTKISQKRYEVASFELESTRRDMMAEVRKAWNPRDYDVSGPLTDQGPDKPRKQDPDEIARAEIIGKMEKIVIPEIDFRQANIHDVVDFLQEASVDFDPETAPSKRKGVNIILNLGVEAPAAAPAAPAKQDFFGALDQGAAAPADSGEVPLITFRARDITLLEAMRIVTEVANLKYRIDGRVLMIVPFDAPEGKIIHRMYDVLPTVRERIGVVSGDIAKAADDFGGALAGGAIEGDATDWKKFFRDLGVDWPQGSSIKYVPTIGKIMVANTADNLAIFEQRLADLNVVPNQIEIEARFVEVAQTDLSSLGFEHILTDDWEIAQKKGGSQFMSGRQRIQMSATAFTKGNRYVSAMPSLGAADDIVTIATVLTNPELAFVLHLLEQKGNADLLSAPKVTTQSGMEAMIKVVTEYIFPSDYDITPGVAPTLNADGTVQSAGTPPVVSPQDFEMREVGVILTVLPEVSAEGQMINLTMTPEVVSEPEWRDYGQTFTDAGGNIQKIPIEQPFFHTRSISTSIAIYNGATVVMGGMINEIRSEVDDRVPYVGSIPILGRLFTSRYEKSEKRNLLIFVTARLVDPAGRTVGGAEEVVKSIQASAAAAEEE